MGSNSSGQVRRATRKLTQRDLSQPKMGMPGGDIYDWEIEEPWVQMLDLAPQDGSVDAQHLALEIASQDPDAEMTPWVRKHLLMDTLSPVAKCSGDALMRRRDAIEREMRRRRGVLNAYPWIIDQYGDGELENETLSESDAATRILGRMREAESEGAE